MVARNSGVKLPPSVLNSSEVVSLLEAHNTRYFTNVRDQAMFVLMWRSMLRCREVIDLRSDDFDYANSQIYVRHGKGDKFRVVGMDDQTACMMQEYEAWIVDHGYSHLRTDGRMFFTHKATAVDSVHLRRKIARMAKKAGITKRVHCHGMRHTGASELAREGVPLPVISAQLGHSSMVTTHTYLRRIAPTEVIRAIRKRSWTEPGGKSQ